MAKTTPCIVILLALVPFARFSGVESDHSALQWSNSNADFPVKSNSQIIDLEELEKAAHSFRGRIYKLQWFADDSIPRIVVLPPTDDEMKGYDY